MNRGCNVKCATVSIICLTLLGTISEAQMIPKLSTLASPSEEVKFSVYNETESPEFRSVINNPAVSPTQPAAVVITNTSKKTIVTISVIWDYTDANGRVTHRSLRSDSFSNPARRPVLKPGSKLFVTPATMIPDTLVSQSYMAPTTGAQQQTNAISASQTIVAQLDLVIFEDGETIGPDQRHYIDEMKARKLAADTLVQAAIHAPEHQQLVNMLSEAASVQPTLGDFTAIWRTRRVAHPFIGGVYRSLSAGEMNCVPYPSTRFMRGGWGSSNLAVGTSQRFFLPLTVHCDSIRLREPDTADILGKRALL